MIISLNSFDLLGPRGWNKNFPFILSDKPVKDGSNIWWPSLIYAKEKLNSENDGFIEFLGAENPGVGTRILMLSQIVANHRQLNDIWRPSWIFANKGLSSETKAFIEFFGPQNPGAGTRIIMISHI